jgi:hypothetical protein
MPTILLDIVNLKDSLYFPMIHKKLVYTNEIKCNKCGSWNKWNNQIFETCYICGDFLDIQTIKKEAQDQERDTLYQDNSFLIIRKNDHLLLRFVKRILSIVNLVFV